MIRAAILWLALLVASAAQGQGQPPAALARLLPEDSRMADAGEGVELVLALTQAVPYRVYTLDAPPRLVVDLSVVNWGAEAALLRPGRATALTLSQAPDGWSRLVADLAAPFALETAGMAVNPDTGAATVTVRLAPATPAAFAAQSGPPPGSSWLGAPDRPAAALPAPAPRAGPLVVAIDPGHGGVDPGAERAGVQEAELMLRLGIAVAEAIDRADGMRAVLTRTDDSFVSLQARLTLARAAGADVLISLHADALEDDAARGATVYTLSPDGAARADSRMAERHERGDLLGGLDLTGQDDAVATALMDLARRETAPQSLRFADTLIAALKGNGVRLAGRPRRDERLAVLGAADFPSVLLEAGFLSDATDRANLQSDAGRQKIADSIVQALRVWQADEAVRAALARQ